MTKPVWLLPSAGRLPNGHLRTVGQPDPKAAEQARYRKWYRSAKGRAYLERTRKARTERSNRLYHSNPARREYVINKNIEYRSRRAQQ